MDAIDLKLITILQENARMPLKNIAAKVFLSSPATAARIEKLEKDGVISSYEVKLDLKKIGFPITAFINLDLDPKLKPTFYPFIQSHPNVLECYCVTGRYSQLIKVAFENTEDLDSFIGELNNFGQTETQIAFSVPQQPRGLGIEKLFSNKIDE